MTRTDSAAYIDPVYAVADELSRRGCKTSAVSEASGKVSQGIISKKWFHIEGVPVFKDDGKPAIDVSQYCDELIKECPHYLWEEHVVDEADLTFIGDGKNRTLKDAGDFIRKYGEKVYQETKLAYGCDDSLRAGTKPGPKDGKKPAPVKDNPYTLPMNDPRRMERILDLVKSNAALALRMAHGAGYQVGGALLRK